MRILNANNKAFKAEFSQHSAGFGTSDKYSVANTGELLQFFESRGFELNGFSHGRVKDAARHGYQRHILRFAVPGAMRPTSLKDSVPEIVVVNSYDGTGALKLFTGLFRLVCANGLIVGESFGPSYSIRHVGNIKPQIDVAIADIVERLPSVAKTVEAMESVFINEPAQQQLANSVAEVVLPKGAVNADLTSALRVRRSADASNNLWTVYNRLQETALKGGFRYQTLVTDKNGNTVLRNSTSQAIRSVARVVDVNRQIFDIANGFLKNVSAA